MKKRKSTRELILEYLDEHLMSSNTTIAHAIGRTPADVSSVTNRLVKAGVLLRLTTEFSATWFYARRENRHVARLAVWFYNAEERRRDSGY